jgi:hypothetical protein
MTEDDRERAAMQRVQDALTASYDNEQRVEQAVEESRRHFEDAPVRDFVPIMVEREVREAMRRSR